MCVFSVGHVFFSVCSPTSPRSFTKLPDISSRGSFFKGQCTRSKVKFLYLGSPLSDLHETW